METPLPWFVVLRLAGAAGVTAVAAVLALIALFGSIVNLRMRAIYGRTASIILG
jgi:hypothetical protein